MVRHLFFDIDDTLFPSSEFAESARKNAIHAMITMGLKQPEKRLYKRLLSIIAKKGSNYTDHFGELCRQLKLKRPARYIAAAVAAYHNTNAAISPHPEVPRTLQQLRDRGYRLYGATNGNAIKQWDKLIRLGLALYFDDVFVSEEVGQAKSMRFFRQVLRKVDAKPGESVMIGDREDADIRPAQKAGLKTIRIRRGKYGQGASDADYSIRNLADLPRILKKL